MPRPGLEDYSARWYDPVAGQFTSADTTLAGGLNRYAYVAGNPETKTDPRGHLYASQRSYSHSLAMWQSQNQPHTYYGSVTAFVTGLPQFLFGTDTLRQAFHTLFQDPKASLGDKAKAVGAIVVTTVTDGLTVGSLFVGEPEVGAELRSFDEGLLGVTDDATHVAATATSDVSEATDASTVATEASADASGVVGDASGARGNAGTVVRYRGTTVASATDVVDGQAIDVERIKHFQSNYSPARGPGVYFTSQSETAAYYADLAGGAGRGMGPAVVKVEFAPESWSAFIDRWGIQDNVPIIGGQAGQLETLIPFDAAPDLNGIGTFSWWLP